MTVSVFDAAFYSAANPDLAKAGLTTNTQLLNHFNTYGLNEGRTFSPLVDLKLYASSNPDLVAAGLTSNKQLLDHLQNFGIRERRQISRFFNFEVYTNENPDVAAAFGSNGEAILNHLQTYGFKENRRFASGFDANYYRSNNADLGKAGLTNSQQLLQHYEIYGASEGRSGANLLIGSSTADRFIVNTAGAIIKNFQVGIDTIAENLPDATPNFIDLVSPFQPLIRNDGSGNVIISTANGADTKDVITVQGVTASALANSPQSFDLHAKGNDVIDWNEITFDVGRIAGLPPAASTRYFALVHTAIQDAVQGILKTPGRQAYLSTLSAADKNTLTAQGGTLPTTPSANASAEAAVAGAAAEILTKLFTDKDSPIVFTFGSGGNADTANGFSPLGGAVTPSSPRINAFFPTVFDAALKSSLARLNNVSQAAKDAGVAYGKQVADALLALRANDGAFRNADGSRVLPAQLANNYINGVENIPSQTKEVGGTDQQGDPTNNGAQSGLENNGTVGRTFNGAPLVGTGPVIAGGNGNNAAKSTPGVWRRAEDTLGQLGNGRSSGNDNVYSPLASIEFARINRAWVQPTTSFFNNNVTPPPALDTARYRENVAEVKNEGSITDIPITNPNSNGNVLVSRGTMTTNSNGVATTSLVANDTTVNGIMGSVVGKAQNDQGPEPNYGAGDHGNDFGRTSPDGIGTTSAERTLIAHIWANDDGTYGPNYEWQKVTQQLANSRGTSLADTAFIFAGLNVGLADGFINIWNIKWDRDDFWRPVTSVRNAGELAVGTDVSGNKTGTSDLFDPKWTPRETTPQHPCHPSGTSMTAGVAGTILADFFGDNSTFTISAAPHPNSDRLRNALTSVNGNDMIPVTTSTGTTMVKLDSLSKTYTSIKQAANEARTSRIYAGAHFRFATESGVNLGEQVSSYFLRHNPFALATGK